MKENNNFSIKKLYYIAVYIFIFLMFTGLFYNNFIELSIEFISHSAFVIILSICLLLYPKFKNTIMEVILIIFGSIYFYTIFFIYPQTATSFTLLCFIPAISILYIKPKLFNFSIALNLLAMIATFGYIKYFDVNNDYAYMKVDLMGNFVNFLIIQLLIYAIYVIGYGLYKNQQLYYEELKDSERLKITAQLSAAVAHEIRNPLTTVKGFLQLYHDSHTSMPKETYSLMISELESAEQVINQFLELEKPNQDHKIEIVNINAVLQNVKESLHFYALSNDNSIDLSTEEDCSILANSLKIRQLFINLIKNAIEASNNGDSIKVRAYKKKATLEIQIIDRGSGISEEELQLLGTPFYSLKSNGTGLGLTVCYHIVDKYNGTINFQSKKNEGTTVTVSFPSN